jgi:ribosome-binding protein aMBF1 (putative translation factor)
VRDLYFFTRSQAGIHATNRTRYSDGEMMKRTTVDDLHKKWLKQRPGYAKAVAELDEQFQLASLFIGARARADLTQEQLAARMKTTRTVISRLESGRMKPSTRTLEKFAHATGHKLKITFEPAEARRLRRRPEARAELNKV